MTVIVRMFRRRPRWYVAGGVVFVAAIGAGVLIGPRAAPAAPQLATAGVGMLSRTVAVTGTVEPAQRADLDFAAGGQVTSVEVTVGQQVAASQALASVDAASLPAQVAQARSSLASAQARFTADSSAGASSAQAAADQTAITAAQAQLDVAQQNASQATLTAPFAGTVAAVNITVGQRVSAAGGTSSASGAGSADAAASGAGSSGAGSSGAGASGVASGSSGSNGSGTAAVVVVSTGSYVLDATVDDTQVGQLKPGQAASIIPNGVTTSIPGTVTSVGLVATSTSGVASYPVILAVTGSPPGLHLGASAQAEITTQEITDAVLVPSAAVHGTGPDSSVTVLDHGTQVSRPVTVGATSRGRTQIVQGLSSGDEVVLPAGAPRTGAGAGSGGGFGGFGGGGTRGTGGPGGGAGQIGAPTGGGGGS